MGVGEGRNPKVNKENQQNGAKMQINFGKCFNLFIFLRNFKDFHTNAPSMTSKTQKKTTPNLHTHFSKQEN